MKRVEVPYGDGTLAATLPEEVRLQVIQPNEVPGKNELLLLREALSDPVSSEPLSEFLGDREEFLVVVNDATRQTPTSKALEGMEDLIQHRKPKFLVATGSHRAPTVEETKSIFGRFYSVFSDRIEYHDARESDTLKVGVTSRGTPVRLNRRLLDFDRVVLINSVEPHYFAGYTGGRKSILPGVASFETIEANHKFALEPSARTLSLQGNPVYEDMVEAVDCLDLEKLFSINLVLDRQQRVCFASAGNINESFLEAAKHSRDVYVIAIDSPMDVIITATPSPSDINLYQSQKALDNAKLAARKESTIIFVTKCREGIGKREFFDLIEGEKSPASVLRRIKSGYRLGWHKAAKLAEMTMEFDILAVTGLPQEDVKRIFMSPFPDLESATSHALHSLGNNVSVLAMPMGSLTVPRIRE